MFVSSPILAINAYSHFCAFPVPALPIFLSVHFPRFSLLSLIPLLSLLIHPLLVSLLQFLFIPPFFPSIHSFITASFPLPLSSSSSSPLFLLLLLLLLFLLSAPFSKILLLPLVLSLLPSIPPFLFPFTLPSGFKFAGNRMHAITRNFFGD